MDVGESVVNVSTIAIPGVDNWLSKYIIKVRDQNTILLYPREGNLTSHLASEKQVETNYDSQNSYFNVSYFRTKALAMLKQMS